MSCGVKMIFSCQRDSYLKELVTKVLRCTEIVKDGKKYYEVILEDTVLFPGGGGQPCDSGTLNGISVLNVQKQNGQVVHVLPSPVQEGEDVTLVLHWQKRFDHMQQHTGQHLISALAENVFKLCTTSWSLGTNESSIELDSQDVSIYQVQQLEQMVNEVIRDRIPVIVNYYQPGDEALHYVRNRFELPVDCDDQVRVVTIQGIDRNTCCGTHLKNTSELQIVKLLYTEKGKKNKTNVYFIAGERLLKYARTCVSRDRTLTQLLKCRPEEFNIHVERLQSSVKITNKIAQNALRDVASLEAKLFNLRNPKPAYYFLHRSNAEPDFISVFLNEARSDETLFFLTVGNSKGANL